MGPKEVRKKFNKSIPVSITARTLQTEYPRLTNFTKITLFLLHAAPRIKTALRPDSPGILTCYPSTGPSANGGTDKLVVVSADDWFLDSS